jgi:hypothetical protein
MSTPFKNGDRLIKFAVGTNDSITFLMALLNALCRKDEISKFTYTENPEESLKAHHDTLRRWSDAAYPEDVFGTPYMIDILNTNPFCGINPYDSFEDIYSAFISNGLLDAESCERTQKMIEAYNDTNELISRMLNSLASPETKWGTWVSNDTTQKKSGSKSEHPLYFCIVFDASHVELLLKGLDLSDFPENATFKSVKGEFHTTLWFCMKEPIDTVKTYLMSGMSSLLGSEIDVQVKCFERNNLFGRLVIELPSMLEPFYKNQAKSHITLVHTGNASEAGLFEATQMVPLETTMTGKVMVSVTGNIMKNTLNM